MDLNNLKIAFFTRSMNYSLYKLSRSTISLPFKHHRLTYTTAQGYLEKILRYDIDYAINIDEDAFVINNNALLRLLEYCIQEKIVNCGMRDGGVLSIRSGNPLVTNPFFNIIDVKTIKNSFSAVKVSKFINNEIDYNVLLPNEFPFKYKITNDYEPFYPFFIWLNANFKVLYLNVKEHEDKYSTILFNQNNQPILYHSWHSRSFGINKFHTDRINNLYKSCIDRDIHFSVAEKVKIELEKICNQKLIPFILPIRRVFKRLIQ